MVNYYTIFSQPVVYKYRSSLCSKAFLFFLILSLITFLFPLIIAYRSQGFWLKAGTYREQPDIHFKHNFLLIIETDELESPIICSTFNEISETSRHFSHCPIIKSREEDPNRDGRNDVLHFEAEVLLPETKPVNAVTLFLLFDYKLYSHSWLQMETATYLYESTSKSGARFDFIADLRLVQKQLLSNQGRDIRFNESLVPQDGFHLPTLLRDYSARNMSTQLMNRYSVWSSGRGLGEPFVLSASIYYPEETILYKPGFWQVIKSAWIQYLSLLILSVLMFRTAKLFVFRNRIVHTIKEVPWSKHYE